MPWRDLATAALGCAALFLVFVLVNPARGCPGDCGSCTGAGGCARPVDGGES